MRQRSVGFTLIELMIVVAIVGILASLAIPSFMGMRARSRQSEAKMNLKAIFSAVGAHFAEHQSYECGFCGWEPANQPLYSYYATESDVVAGKYGCPTSQSPGQRDPGEEDPDGGFVVAAAGNLDGDLVCDSWTIDQANSLVNVTNDAEM